MTSFRCPYDVRGTQGGTIIDVALPDARADRIDATTRALRQLYADPTRTAVRLILPRSAWSGCTSNAELVGKILPYQCDFLAADMHVRLWPFLPFHREGVRRLWLMLTRARTYERQAARVFTRWLSQGRRLSSPLKLSLWLEAFFAGKYVTDPEKMTFEIGNVRRHGQGDAWLMKFDPSAFATYIPEDMRTDPASNKALFTIVKTPFYPTDFGRYSEDVELIVTRDVDVERLDPLYRLLLRRKANAVHMAHGVYISEPDTEQQPTGLWLPRMRSRS